LVVNCLIELGLSLHISHFFLNHSLEVLNVDLVRRIVLLLDIVVNFFWQIYLLGEILLHLLILIRTIIINPVNINFRLLYLEILIFINVRIIEVNVSFNFKWFLFVLRWFHKVIKESVVNQSLLLILILSIIKVRIIGLFVYILVAFKL